MKPSHLHDMILIQQKIASSRLSEKDLLLEICSETEALVEANGSVVEFLVDEQMEYIAASGSCRSFVGLKIPCRNSLSGFCVEAKEIMICTDTETDGRVNREACRKIGARSMLLVPLLSYEKTIGVLKVVSEKVDAFDSTDVETLSMISGFLGVAIHKVRINEELEKKVAERTAELRSMTESIPQLVWQTDERGEHLYTNSKWQEYVGRSEFGWQNGTHPHDAGRVMIEWKSALVNKTTFQMECRLLSKAGEYRWFYIRGLPVLGPDGKTLKWYGTCTDIHEQKLIEEKIKRSEDEHLAMELREKAAQEASHIKSEFLAHMSHEIRTPINGIIGMSNLLIDTAIDSEQREYTEAISNSASGLLNIINDILDFSKIEAGKLELEMMDFNLHTLLSEIEISMRLMAQKKNIDFKCRVDSEVFPVYRGDSGRLRQILYNLIGNAVKFTAQGHVKIRVQALPNTGLLRFEVTDTGIGVPLAAQERMFKAFSQADSSMSRRFGGTGLGLSISKRLVELMNGKIGVVSKENSGSTFWFEVPLAKGNESKTSSANPVQIEKAKKIVRILLAEDNPINQIVAAKNLEKIGHRVQTVANGHEVLDALHNFNFDLILMDCQMPEMDGYEATRAIRSSTTLPCRDIPIIAMTANAIAGDREHCLESGMNDYISKPVEIGVLAKMIEKWIPPSPEQENKAVIEIEAIEKLLLIGGGNEDFLPELIDMYLEDSSMKIINIENFAKSKEYKKLAQEAHSLKSSSLSFGAKSLADVCKELEKLDDQTNLEWTAISKETQKLASIFSQLRPKLIELKNQIKKSA